MEFNIAYVPKASPSSPVLVALEDIPVNVAEAMEEAYTVLRANPNGNLHATFANKAELHQFLTWARSYCEQRTPEIRFRKSPVKGLPENEMKFTVTDPLTPNEKVTEEIREATAAANATPATVTPAKKTRKAA